MALFTPHVIYSDVHWREIAELFTDNEVTSEFKATELSRLIEEALIYDDRILEVTDIDVEQVMTLFTENLKYIVMKELINITLTGAF